MGAPRAVNQRRADDGDRAPRVGAFDLLTSLIRADVARSPAALAPLRGGRAHTTVRPVPPKESKKTFIRYCSESAAGRPRGGRYSLRAVGRAGGRPAAP